jgi:hypothetical protein
VAKSDKSDFGWERVREARAAHFGQTKPRSGAWKKDHLRLWETIVGSVPLFRVGRLHRHRWDDDHRSESDDARTSSKHQ